MQFPTRLIFEYIRINAIIDYNTIQPFRYN